MENIFLYVCVCVCAAWPWHHAVNIVLFSAWLAHSFFNTDRCCMTRLNVKPPFNLESVKLFKSLCDMLMRDSGARWGRSFPAACRRCYLSRANWIASWFKSGQNLPLLAMRGNIKKNTVSLSLSWHFVASIVRFWYLFTPSIFFPKVIPWLWNAHVAFSDDWHRIKCLSKTKLGWKLVLLI